MTLKIQLCFTGINYILKNIKIVLQYFLSHRYSLDEPKKLFPKDANLLKAVYCSVQMFLR